MIGSKSGRNIYKGSNLINEAIDDQQMAIKVLRRARDRKINVSLDTCKQAIHILLKQNENLRSREIQKLFAKKFTLSEKYRLFQLLTQMFIQNPSAKVLLHNSHNNLNLSKDDSQSFDMIKTEQTTPIQQNRKPQKEQESEQQGQEAQIFHPMQQIINLNSVSQTEINTIPKKVHKSTRMKKQIQRQTSQAEYQKPSKDNLILKLIKQQETKNNIVLLILIVTNQQITAPMIEIEGILGQIQLSMLRSTNYDSNCYSVFLNKIPIESNFQENVSMKVSWQETNNQISQIINANTYHNKLFTIINASHSQINLSEQINTRSIFYCNNMIMLKKQREFKNCQTESHSKDNIQKDLFRQVFQWVQLFKREFPKIDRSQAMTIWEEMSDIRNELGLRVSIYLLLLIYRDKTFQLVKQTKILICQSIGNTIEAVSISDLHKYCKLGFMKIAYLSLLKFSTSGNRFDQKSDDILGAADRLKPMDNDFEIDRYDHEGGFKLGQVKSTNDTTKNKTVSKLKQLLNQNIGKQNHETTYELILETIKYKPEVCQQLLADELLQINQLLSTELFKTICLQQISNKDYFTLATYILRPNLSQPYINVLTAFSKSLLDRFKSQKPDPKKKLPFQIHKENIREMFLTKRYQKGEFALGGKDFVKFLMFMKEIKNYDSEIYQLITTSIEKEYQRAFSQCLQSHAQLIVPFYLQNPMAKDDQKIVESYFNKLPTQYTLTVQKLKQILLRCFSQSKKYLSIYNNQYLVDQLIKTINKLGYDTLQIIKVLNKILTQLQKPDQKELLLKVAIQKLAEPNFKNQDYQNTIERILQLDVSLKGITLTAYGNFVKVSQKRIQRDRIVASLIDKNVLGVDLVIKELYSGENLTEQTKFSQIWHAVKQQPILLNTYRQKYKNTLQHDYQYLINQLCKKLQEKDLSEPQLEKIYNQQTRRQSFKRVPKDCELKQTMQKLVNDKRNFEKKLQNLLYIFSSQKVGTVSFEDQINEVHSFESSIRDPQNKLKTSLTVSNDYQEILETSQQILTLMGLIHWKPQNIDVTINNSTQLNTHTKIQAILHERVISSKVVQRFVGQFQQKELLLSNFQVTFLVKQVLEDLLLFQCLNKQSAQQIKTASRKLNDKHMNQLLLYCESLNYLSLTIEGTSKEQLKPYVKMYKERENPQTLNVEKMLTIHDETARFFSTNYQIDVCSDKELGLVVLETGKANKLLKFVEDENIDEGKVVNLRDYVSNLESSAPQFHTILQFEDAINYWDQIVQQTKRNEKTLQGYIKRLKTRINNEQSLTLSKSICNANNNLHIIKQKMEQAQNRQATFKYIVQRMFKNSTFKVQVSQQYYQIDVIFDILNPHDQSKENADKSPIIDEQDKRLNYKRLLEFYQKCQPLIKELKKKNNSNKEKTDPMIKLLTKFQQMFKYCQKVMTSAQQLIKYGSPPSQIQVQTRKNQIQQHNIDRLSDFSEMLEKRSQQWRRNITPIYEKSYLLTHFTGAELNSLVNQTFQKKYTPSLQHISGRYGDNCYSQEKFTALARNEARGFEETDPIKRVQVLQKFYQKFQQEKDNIRGTRTEIHLIKSKPQHFYAYLSSKTQINQILYCQKDTTDLQIQVFLFRAKLKQQKIHYIIAVHNLIPQLQYQMCQWLSQMFKNDKNNKNVAQFKFIDTSLNDKVMLHLNTSNFNSKINQILKQGLQSACKKIAINNQLTHLIESSSAGLGKTHYARSKSIQKKLIYFPVTGNVSSNSLRRRLNKLIITQDNTLLIQIGSVQDKSIIQTFLFQIIIFRCYNYRGFIYLPKNIKIFIEMENIQDLRSNQRYYILEILRQYSPLYHKIHHFDLSQMDNKFDTRDQFTLTYLNLIKNHKIGKREVKEMEDQKQKQQGKYKDLEKEIIYGNSGNQNYQDNQNNKEKIGNYEHKIKKNRKSCVRTPSKWYQIIDHFFVQRMKREGSNPSFSLLREFLDILHTTFTTFSEVKYLQYDLLRQIHREMQWLQLDKVRQKFLKICVDNAFQSLKQWTNPQQQTNSYKKFPLIIIPTDKNMSYEFVYSDTDQVPIEIKSLILSQDHQLHRRLSRMGKFDESAIHKLYTRRALTEMKDYQLQLEMYRILHNLSGNMDILISDMPKQHQQKKKKLEDIKNKVPELRKYSLTHDNFLKICLIIQRIKSKTPVIIMGESGVGKTQLITFLAETIYRQQFQQFNVHAGIDQNKLQQWFQIIKQRSQKLKTDSDQHNIKNNRKDKRLWVFFDQFNTTDQLGYIKQMVVDRRFQGQQIPNNVVMIAACNPYRKKTVSHNRVVAGLKRQSKDANTLAFKVLPLPISMIQFMWNYQQLKDDQLQAYVTKILKNKINEHEAQKLIKNELSDVFLKNDQNQLAFKFIKAIVQTHRQFKQSIQLSSVSLRDVTRFWTLYKWFYENVQTKKPDELSYKPIVGLDDSYYDIKPYERSLILALAYTYCLKYASFHERNQYLNNMERLLGFEHNMFSKVAKNEQIDFVCRLKSPQTKIALNLALRENIHATAVCLMNKIPILIIGSPGSSKSLCTKIIVSNFRARNSQKQFCKGFPAINMVYFQGSETCTSKGVQVVFEKVQTLNESLHRQSKQPIKSYEDKNNCYVGEKQDIMGQKKEEKENSKSKKVGIQIENCILFDEIGLAQDSQHNPLKVLHSKLETKEGKVAFIGISNWELDAAKMSRFLVLSRTSPELDEIQETAVQIYKSYVPQASERSFKEYQKLGKYYYEFLQRWKAMKQDNLQDKTIKQGFFGLRDFYSFIKYICQNNKSKDQQRVLAKSIQINFDGQPNSIKIFNQIAKIKFIKDMMNPVELVKQNLSTPQLRCLLLVVKGDALVPIINNSIRKQNSDGNNRQVICLYGSTFKDDQQSQQYNTEVTTRVISYITQDLILTFRDINDSIQTSLYDLFNKSFYQFSNKKYCRIAVGANSNSKCLVNNNFNSIVYIDETKVQSTDLAFLNRFQKHHLTLEKMLSSKEQKIMNDIETWLREVLSFKVKEAIQQNYFVNSGPDALFTLITKHQQTNNNNSDILKNIKLDLLRNRTKDFQIAIDYKKVQHHSQEVLNLIKEIPQLTAVTQNMILYTYDEHTERQAHIHQIRLREIRSERQLRSEIDTFLDSQANKLEIYIVYQKQWRHINLILYLIQFLKEEKIAKLPIGSKFDKRVKVIVQIHRYIDKTLIQLNISYLHKFQQYFTQDIAQRSKISTDNLLEIRSYTKLFETLNLKDKLFTYVHKTYEYIHLQKSDYSKFYFTICDNLLTQNTYGANKFKQTITNHIKKQLQQKYDKNEIDYFSILNDMSQFKNCSSVKDVIYRNLENVVVQILCRFIERVFTSNLIFNFDLKLTLKLDYFQNSSDEKYLYPDETNYNQIFKTCLEQYVMNVVDQDSNLYQEQDGNIRKTIQVTFPTVFPLSSKDFPIIFITKGQKQSQETIQDKTARIFEQCYSLERKNIGDLKSHFNQGIKIFQKKSHLILNNKKKSSQTNFITKMHQQNQILYSFDLLQFLFNSNNLSRKHICSIHKIILNALKDDKKQKSVLYSLELYAVLFSMERERFWANILEIMVLTKQYNKQAEKQWRQLTMTSLKYRQLISSNLQSQFDKEAQGHNQFIIEVNIVARIFSFGCNVLQSAIDLLSIDQRTEDILKIQTKKLQQFLILFTKVHCSVERMLSNYKEMDLSSNWQFDLNMHLIETFSLLNKETSYKISLNQFLLYLTEKGQQGVSYHINMLNFCKKLLIIKPQDQFGSEKGFKERRKSEDKRTISIMLDFLSFELFPGWLMSIPEQDMKEDNQQLKQQLNQFVLQFIQLANSYPQFANNSTEFFKILYNNQNFTEKSKEKVKDCQQFKNYLYQITHSRFPQTMNIVDKNIDYRTNFTIALGNYFGMVIRNMTQKQNFLQSFYDLFKDTMASKEFIIKTQRELFLTQFLKLYCIHYAEYLQEMGHQNQQGKRIAQEIEKLICHQHPQNQQGNERQLRKHLCLYILKSLYISSSNIIQLRQFAKLKWATEGTNRKFFESIHTPKVMIPPKINDKSIIRKLFDQCKAVMFLNTQVFQNILGLSHENPSDMYQLLTLLMTQFYTGSVQPQCIARVKTIIEDKKDLDHFQKKFMLKYVEMKISENIMFQNGKDFVDKQLLVLNFLNMILASKHCKEVPAPLLEMFYSKQGKFNKDWMSQRYIVGGAGQKFDGKWISKKNRKATSIQVGITSQKDSEQKVQEKSENMDQAPINPKPVQTEEQNLQPEKSSKQQTTNAQQSNQLPQLELTEQENLDQIVTELISNSRVNIATVLILNQMTFGVWSIFLDNEYFQEDWICKLFNSSRDQTVKALMKISTKCEVQLQSISKIEDRQNFVAWQLLVSKSIFNSIIDYKSLIKERDRNDRVDFKLTEVYHRDKNQKIIDQIIKPSFQKSLEHKQKDIVTTKILREQSDLTNQNYLNDKISLQYIQKQYKLSRLFKINQLDRKPDWNNLKARLGDQDFTRSYPYLNFLLTNEQILRKLTQFKKVCIFISDLIKTYDWQLYRKDTEEQTLLNYARNNPTIKLNEFLDAWNKLFIQGNNLNINSSIKLCLPDNRGENHEGKKILQAIQNLSKKHNQLVKLLKLQIRHSQSEGIRSNNKSTKNANPTQLPESVKLLGFPSKMALQNDLVGCFCVEFGKQEPHYALNRLQSQVMQQFSQFNILEQNRTHYRIINFRGQSKNVIKTIKSCIWQASEHTLPASLEQSLCGDQKLSVKELKAIKGEIQFLANYCQAVVLSNDDQHLKRIADFIQSFQIKQHFQELNKETFKQMQMSSLVFIYELVQIALFQQLPKQIIPIQQKLSNQDIETIEKAFKKLTQDKRAKQHNICQNFVIAIYRAISRNLLDKDEASNQTIAMLLQNDQLWNKAKIIFISYCEDKNEYLKKAISLPVKALGYFLQKLPQLPIRRLLRISSNQNLQNQDDAYDNNSGYRSMIKASYD